MPNTPDLVEPSGEPVKDAQISQSGVAQRASTVDTSQSASASLFRAMQDLPPAKPADLPKTAAQKASESQAPEKPEKKDFPAIGKSDVKEHKQVEGKADEKPESGSALEGFQKGHQKARRDKRIAQNQETADAEEKKLETQQPEKTDAENQQPADDAPVTDEEIEKTIADPGISKRHQKRMVHLATRAKELEQKLKEAEAKPQSAANDAKIKELEEKQAAADKELVQYRRRYSLESEPELKKFDDVVKTADEAILKKLGDVGLSEKTIELIKGMGGFEGFSRSNQTFTINVKDVDTGEMRPTVVTGAQLARSWLNDMNVADSEYIKAKMSERFQAIDGKKRRSDELTAGAETWFKEQQQNYEKAVKEQENRVSTYRADYDKKISTFLESLDGLKDKPVPSTASAEEKKEIEDYNRYNAGVRALAKAAVHPASLDDHVAVVQEAANSLIASRENRQLKKENAALKEQLQKVQKGSSTTGKGGGNSILTTPKPKDNSAAAQLQTSAADSLRDAMEKLRNGGSEE